MPVASYAPAEERLRSMFGKLQIGSLDVSTPSAERHSFVGLRAGPHARLQLKTWDAVDELARLEAGCIERYLQGAWDSSDLAQLLTFMQTNAERIREVGWRRLWSAVRASISVPTRANIHARYRLDNAFFAAWLDRSMAYSAGCFDGDDARGLHEAQLAKYEMILSALKPGPKQTLLDIGCGWGGFAVYIAARSGCRVHAISISQRQVQWAREQVRAAGLEDRVNVERRDYRDLYDAYDCVVSLEAYEATGRRAWPSYFAALARRLKPGGAVFLQAAFVDDRARGSASTNQFLRRNIHANAALAPRQTLQDELQRAGLWSVNACNAVDDAVRTLRCWRQRFQEAHARLVLDDRFCRLWNFYLAYCEARYRSGCTGLLRAQLRHAA